MTQSFYLYKRFFELTAYIISAEFTYIACYYFACSLSNQVRFEYEREKTFKLFEIIPI